MRDQTQEVKISYEDSKAGTNSSNVDIPFSNPSNIGSFNAQVFDHSSDPSPKNHEQNFSKSKFNSPEKQIKGKNPEEDENSGSQNILEEDHNSVSEDEKFELEKEILRPKIEDLKKEIEKNTEFVGEIEAVVEEIEVFQKQFEDNPAIETFTNNFLKELKDLSDDLEDMQDEIREILQQEIAFQK